MHWVAEMELLGHCTAAALVGSAAPNGVIITADMVANAEFYLNDLRVHYAGAQPLGVELEMDMSAFIPGVQGTCDWAGYFPATQTLSITDYKNGWKPVEVEDNWQLTNYGLGGWKHADNLGLPVARVEMRIVQPNPYHPDGKVRAWTVPANEMVRRAETLNAAALATHDPNASTVPGPHCLYCRALTICEGNRVGAGYALDLSGRSMIDSLDMDETAREFSVLSAALSIMQNRTAALEGAIIDHIRNGKHLPGWSVTRGQGRRYWRSLNDIKIVEGLSGLDLHESKPVTPAQAEKRGLPKDVVNAFVQKNETGLKLVPVDIAVKAREVFNT